MKHKNRHEEIDYHAQTFNLHTQFLEDMIWESKRKNNAGIVRTLEDMSEAEIVALEQLYGAKVIRPDG